MRIGIVTDIHEETEPLRRALEAFQHQKVDVVISLGDVCDTFSAVGNTRAVVNLLQQAHAIGVWGNHDFGLCYEVQDKLRERVDATVLEYMTTMQPFLVQENCRFSHVEPWLNARAIEDLWYFDGPPDTAERASRSFHAVAEQFLFIGHFHRWLAVSTQGVIPWHGEAPLQLQPNERYLIVVAPIVSGAAAIFDSEKCLLIPIDCKTNEMMLAEKV